MSSFSINGITQVNLSLNIDNKKNIENIQVIINDLKELIDILSFRISDVYTSTEKQISENVAEQVDQQIDSTIPDFSSGVTNDNSGTGDNTVSNPVVAYY